MVADDIDDDYHVDGIADDAKNDRTHKIQLSGKFKITNVTADGSDHAFELKTPVPVEKKVTLNIIIMNLTVGGAPVIQQTDVENDLKIAQERYAQVGIKLKWSTNIKDSPAGVDLTDGLLVASGNPATMRKVSPEARNLIGAWGTTSPQADISVFYVNIVDAFGFAGNRGVAIADYWFDASEGIYLNNCFVAASRRPFTLPHELAHLLADESHHSSTYNLLKDGTSTTNSVGASKRLEVSQESKIQSNPKAK